MHQNVTLCQLTGMVDRMQNDAIDRTDGRINQLGASLFLDAVTIETANRHGVLDVVALIFGGRAGAIGDIDVARMTDAFPFVSPTMLEACWPAIESAGGPVALQQLFSEAVSDAARAHWDVAALRVIGATARDVIAPVDGVAPGLFTAWRTIALDATPSGVDGGVGGDVASLFALRELRGDLHIESVRAIGLTPLEAEIATRGPVVAELHGWPAPYPDTAPYEQRSLAAGRLTSERMAEIYDGAVDDAAFGQFVDALGSLVANQG